jgi:CheY-like chemotaxis protein
MVISARSGTTGKSGSRRLACAWQHPRYALALDLAVRAGRIEGADSVTENSARQRVLVVDDLDEMRTIVQRALRARGYEVDVAGTLADAIGMDPGGYDAVLVDAHLGSERGIELLEALRSNEPAAARRCIVMTGGPADEIPDNVTCLVKPFQIEELIDAVHTALHPDSLPVPDRPAAARPPSSTVPKPGGGEPRPWQLLSIARQLRAHERQELVDFLHDGPIQELTALTLELQMMSKSMPAAPAPRFDAVFQRLNAAAESLRWLIDGNWPFLAPETRLTTALQQRTAWLLAVPAAVDTYGEAAGLGAAAEVPVIVDVVELMLLEMAPAGPPVLAHVAVHVLEQLIHIELTLTSATSDGQPVGDPVAAQAALDGLAAALGASAHIKRYGEQLQARIELKRQSASELTSSPEGLG